jgi:hypothetical protein
MANLRKISHDCSIGGLRKRTIGITECAIEFDRHCASSVSIAISSSSILFIECEGSQVLRTNRSGCDAEQAA